MSTDEAQLDDFRRMLAADDYHLDLQMKGEVAQARIDAGPNACAECLVPKPVFAAMLSPLVGVPVDRIEITYPADAAGGTD